jgi:hypothetical protein
MPKRCRFLRAARQIVARGQVSKFASTHPHAAAAFLLIRFSTFGEFWPIESQQGARRPSSFNWSCYVETKIEDGHLVIRIPLQKPTPSSSGKTLIVATSGGNVVTTAMVDGKPVVVGLNAYIKK